MAAANEEASKRYAAARAAEKAAKEAKREEEERPMREWIAAHGSERLKRCLAEGIECRAAYRDERLAAERPGWVWADGSGGEVDAPRNPPAESFTVLDEARKTDPSAKLMRWTENRDEDDENEDDDDDGEETAPPARHYIAVAEFLGRGIEFHPKG